MLISIFKLWKVDKKVKKVASKSETSRDAMDSTEICLDLLVTGHVNSYVSFFEQQSTIEGRDLALFQKLLVAIEDAQRSG
jgi:hypothetical protein